MTLGIELPDLGATEAFAAQLAAALLAPLVIGLKGDLGTGKTALVRALIQSLAAATRVKSPTYSLIESYELPGIVVHHLDLYRVRHPDELVELGLADLLGNDAVMLIEWPGQGGARTPPLDMAISLKRIDENARRAELESLSSAGAGMIDRLRAA